MSDLRREFSLPVEDVEILDAFGYEFETIRDNGEQIVLIKAFPIPEGYNIREAEMLVKLGAYPEGKLDMAWFHPDLVLVPPKPIPNLTSQGPVDGRMWQQWSRHDTNEHPWKVGEYNFHQFVIMVRSWLRKELTR